MQGPRLEDRRTRLRMRAFPTHPNTKWVVAFALLVFGVLFPLSQAQGVLRRIYGKDNRVLHTAELSQSLKVGTHSRTRQGAGISTGSTKIGVIGSATLHGEAEIEPGEAATPGSQEICEALQVRLANGSRHTGGRRWFSMKNTAGTQ
jgi:hypothetical protein